MGNASAGVRPSRRTHPESVEAARSARINGFAEAGERAVLLATKLYVPALGADSFTGCPAGESALVPPGPRCLPPPKDSSRLHIPGVIFAQRGR